MAAVSPSCSLVAAHDCYRKPLGSTSSNSSCGSANMGKTSLTIQASIFFGKTTHPVMTTVSESPENPGTLKMANCMITCGLAQDQKWQQKGGESSVPSSAASSPLSPHPTKPY
uniref:Pancreatic progenitor cell differentiation and proliferation factor n=1 Tax=Podarcis muralis TaxID=64176 RepID=A0A670K134_PODMU